MLSTDILSIIKPECIKCPFYADVFVAGKLVQQCSKSECYYKHVTDELIHYLDEHYYMKTK